MIKRGRPDISIAQGIALDIDRRALMVKGTHITGSVATAVPTNLKLPIGRYGEGRYMRSRYDIAATYGFAVYGFDRYND